MIGYIASILVTIAYLPQAYDVYKTKVCMMSGLTITMLMVAMFAWIMHAVIRADFALLTSSVFSLLQLGFISFYKLKEGRKT